MNAGATSWLWLAQLGSTLPLVGLIWFVQVVAYPLFAQAGDLERAAFLGYHQAHSRRITYVVLPLMVAELLSAGGWLWLPPAGVPRSVTWIGFGLVVTLWLATAFVSVPRHEELAHGFDARVQRALVTTNWIRTACWTARGILLLWLLASTPASRNCTRPPEVLANRGTSHESGRGDPCTLQNRWFAAPSSSGSVRAAKRR